jgi:outer membrane lipoprotein LolB
VVQRCRRRRGIARAQGVLVLVLAGCATPPPGPEPEWTEGRLALQVQASPARPAQSLSLGFELRGDAERGELRLNGPLGTRVAQARWSPGEAWLDDGQGPVRYAGLEALSTQALGEPLPLQALPHWLAGQPWPGAAHEPLPPPEVGFTQLQWRVDLSRHGQGQVLARRDSPPAVQLRVRLDRVPGSIPGQPMPAARPSRPWTTGP